MQLFAAVDLPASIRERLLPLCSGLPGARWVTADQMHLTLRFFGTLDGALARDIADALAAIRAPAFRLQLERIGHFGSGRRVRVLWAGVRPEPLLDHLQAKVEHAARRNGLPLESRRFQPHVTLARFRGPSPDLSGYFANFEPFRTDEFDVREFAMMSSSPSSSGTIYRVEERFPLADPA